MPSDQAFGFKSRLVLHKLGFDLRRSLDETAAAALPEAWCALIDEIGDRADDTLTLHPPRREARAGHLAEADGNRTHPTLLALRWF